MKEMACRIAGCPSRCFWNRRDIDGATVHKLNMTTLREIHCAAVDHATMISYWKKDPQDKSSGKSALLLDMVAGHEMFLMSLKKMLLMTWLRPALRMAPAGYPSTKMISDLQRQHHGLPTPRKPTTS